MVGHVTVERYWDVMHENWLRETRTGIYGGYLAEHPQWYLHFYPSEEEMKMILERHGLLDLSKFEGKTK